MSESLYLSIKVAADLIAKDSEPLMTIKERKRFKPKPFSFSLFNQSRVQTILTNVLPTNVF